MNHFFKKNQLGFSGTYKNNNYFCLSYPTNILIYSFRPKEEVMSTTAGNFDFVLLLNRYFVVQTENAYFLLSNFSLYSLVLTLMSSKELSEHDVSVIFSSRCTLLMKLIKHHAWQSNKLTLWEPGGYRFNSSWFSKTTISLYNNMPQSWWRKSSALILSLPPVIPDHFSITHGLLNTQRQRIPNSSGKNKPG